MKEEFKKELSALLDKYNAFMVVQPSASGMGDEMVVAFIINDGKYQSTKYVPLGYEFE